MSMPIVPVPPHIAELGVLSAAIILLRCDEDEKAIYLEIAVSCASHLAPKQLRDLSDACEAYYEPATSAVAATILQMMRDDEAIIHVSFGVYSRTDGE